MKTFETEKGNIPEGATHYMEQSELTYFAWGKFDGEKLSLMLTNESQWTRVSCGLFYGLKPIPQTKEVEWVNGDIANTPDGEGCLVAEVYQDGYSYWIVQFKDNFHSFHFSELSKPETTEQKLERERIKAAKHLYSKHCAAVRHPVQGLDSNSGLLNAWLVIVDETNYKVKGN